MEINKVNEINNLKSKIISECSLIENPTISSIAVRSIISTGVIPLVGMRSLNYVDDIVYGGGSKEYPYPMTPLDFQQIIPIFNLASKQLVEVRADIRQKYIKEEEVMVEQRSKEAEDRALSLKPKK